MFDGLSDRLARTAQRLRGQGRLTEDNIKDALREVRMALLEAERIAPDAIRYSDVARNVVTASIKRAKRRGAVPGLDGLAQRIGVVA